MNNPIDPALSAALADIVRTRQLQEVLKDVQASIIKDMQAETLPPPASSSPASSSPASFSLAPKPLGPSPFSQYLTNPQLKPAPEFPIDPASIGIEMVLCPAGSFMMGAADDDTEAYDDEFPGHRVEITEPFYIAKYQTTRKQFKAVMGYDPSHFQDGDENCPVESVTHYEASEFAWRLGSLLPTEEQWEYAARAGCEAPRYGDVDDIAIHWGNSGGRPHPVGTKKPNAWGLYDMLGNVWEWTSSVWESYKDKLRRLENEQREAEK